MTDFVSTHKRLLSSLAFNLGLGALAFLGGWLGNSVTLIAVALHNFTDASAILIGFLAIRQQGNASGSGEDSNIFARTSVLAAIVNSIILCVVVVFILVSGISRILTPATVSAPIVVGVGILSLVLTAGVAFLLLPQKHEASVNRMLPHAADDILNAGAVVLSGIVIAVFGWSQVDGLASLFVAAVVLRGAWVVISDAVSLLTEAVPDGIRLSDIAADMRDVKGVRAVHELHVWGVGSAAYALSAHVRTHDAQLGALAHLSSDIKGMLREKHHIEHATLEFECANCDVPTA